MKNALEKVKKLLKIIFALCSSLFRRYPYTVVWIAVTVIVAVVKRDTVALLIGTGVGLFGRFLAWVMKQEITIGHIRRK